jgi:hypothetical protein
MLRPLESVPAGAQSARSHVERRRRAVSGICWTLLVGFPSALVAAEPSAGLPAEAGPPVEALHRVEVSAAAGSAKEADDEHAAPEENGFKRAVDAVHDSLSVRVERTAKRADAFFADDRYYADTTDTYARLSLETTFENDESAKSEARLRVRVDLPGTEERLRVFLEGGETDVGEGTESGSIPEALDDNEYNLGLEAQLPSADGWDIRPGVGMKVSGGPDPFVRIRATRYMPLGRWLSRFAAGAAEFVDDGTEVQARLDFDRKLSPDLLFRSASRARWLDRKDRYDFVQSLTLFQRLNSRSAMGYDVGFRANDDPDWDVSAYFTQVRFRHRAYRKWLFLEVAPQIVFREEDDYDPSYRLAIRADAVFGERYRSHSSPPAIPH